MVGPDWRHVSLFLAGCVVATTAHAAQISASDILVFAPNAPHPNVAKTIGPIRAFACPLPHSGEPNEAEALDRLKLRASAIGASGVIDLEYKNVRQSPRSECWRRTYAKGKAVMFEAGSADAAQGAGTR